MDEKQLNEIEQRAERITAYGGATTDEERIAGEDVPALLAEVTRLRSELPKCNGMCLTAADVGVPVAGNPVARAHRSCPEHGDLEAVAWELDAALTEAEADRDRAREITVALEQQLAEIKRLAYMGPRRARIVRRQIRGVFERANTLDPQGQQDIHVCSPQTCGAVYNQEEDE